MTCREMDDLILFTSARLTSALGDKLPAEAQAHLATCPHCRALLGSLVADSAGRTVSPAVLEGIRKPILASVTPVRPMPGTAALTAVFCLLFGLAAAVGSFFLGFAGFHALSPVDRVAVCFFLLVLAIAAAFAIARNMRPAARGIPGWLLLTAAVLAFEGLFFLLLKDYSPGRFLHSGVICLGFGLLCALPAALLALFVLRKGYVVAPVATGAAVGVGAGMVGLTVIELHCPIETFPHVAVWHVGIFVLSAGMGALAGVLSRNFRAFAPRSS